MKAAFWIPFALLAGLVLGGLGPRQSMRRERDELERLRKAVRSERPARTDFGNMVDFLRFPGTAGPATAATGTVRVADQPDASGVDVTPVATGTTERVRGGRTNLNMVSFQERIEEASELWRIRSDMVRSGFLRSARLTPEQTVQFDVLVEAMNIRLKDRIAEWTEVLEQAESVSPETGVRMINDLSEVLVLTYDEMDRTLSPEWRQNAGTSFDLGSLIDPAVAMPLTKVEPKFRDRARMRRTDPVWNTQSGGAPVSVAP
ncbi:MAG: hypothetical protein A2340_03415 [Lentisphaerae bacterium RIFOXYB12_FULL_60_10]|nr:MAG: hypothetical protein A2340_03415 [Lentisphaerae bacterium RIFOXYB12_FULL_60_10]